MVSLEKDGSSGEHAISRSGERSIRISSSFVKKSRTFPIDPGDMQNTWCRMCRFEEIVEMNRRICRKLLDPLFLLV